MLNTISFFGWWRLEDVCVGGGCRHTDPYTFMKPGT